MRFWQAGMCMFLFVLFYACGRNNDSREAKLVPVPVQNENTSGPPSFSGAEMELKTYVVTDTVNRKIQGWGYDIYIDGKRAIHQPIIPAIPGNNSFSSEEKARATGTYAINKMKQSGTLPTLTTKELDSLGVTN